MPGKYDYTTKPSNILPGIQMFGQRLDKRADFERSRVKEQKAENLKRQAAEMLGSTPEEMMKFVKSNPGSIDIYNQMLGVNKDTMVNSAKRRLLNGEDAVTVATEEAETIDAKEGEDASDSVENLVEHMTNPDAARKKDEMLLALFDEKAYKSYMAQKGGVGVEVDAAFKKQKTAAYLVKNAEGNTQIIAGVFDPRTGKIAVEGGDLPEGYEPVSKLGETGTEESTRKIGQKKGEKIVSGQESRATSLIDRGITAAESTATIRRGIELLDSVKTGGYNNAALRAKQIFGIESANEGELSNSLGKSVLSQLRETFGAAFTENEGNRLARIEAAFGKSPEANKRLLQQALRLSERTAKRARDAAYKREDMDTVNDINDLLNFTLSDPDVGQVAPEQPQKNDVTQGQPAPQTQFTEGQTATGGKYIYTGGQWRLNQ